MFFVAGIQPKIITVDETPRICPACGLAQARLKRVDHYVSLFFIPLFRVKKGEDVICCERCQGPVTPGGWQHAAPPGCQRCGKPIDAHFQFCPHCGARQTHP